MQDVQHTGNTYACSLISTMAPAALPTNWISKCACFHAGNGNVNGSLKMAATHKLRGVCVACACVCVGHIIEYWTRLLVLSWLATPRAQCRPVQKCRLRAQLCSGKRRHKRIKSIRGEFIRKTQRAERGEERERDIERETESKLAKATAKKRICDNNH